MSIISMIRKPVPVPLREAGEVEIDVRDVTIAFERDSGELVPAVDRVSFQVRRSEFICLLGPSGCGKSTLLNAVAGFETPYEGEVVVGTKVVTGPGPDRGVVFQQPRLFPWKSVRANVAHGPRMAGKSRADAGALADELIEMVGLSRSAKALPHTLSGGMQQRVAIARALAQDPQILLMDEPFGALDEITRTEMQQELLRVWSSRRKTVIFVTHSITEALYLSDRVLVMRPSPGAIAAEYRIDAPRPRDRADPALLRLHAELWEHLK